MEIRHLRYMMAVAEERHFLFAAHRLHIAPPALSQNIRQLEEEIGTRLFERTTRKVELTNAGKVFYQQALLMLRNFENLPVVAQRASSGSIGSVAVGFTDTAIFGPLRDVIRNFRRKYPAVRIIPRACGPESLFELLQSGSIDVACNEECVTAACHHSVQLAKTDIVVALPRDHRLAKQTGSIELKILDGEDFIFPAQNTTWSVHEKLMRALVEAGITPHQAYTVDSAIRGVALVAAGLGVSFVPEFTQILSDEVVFRRLCPRLSLTPQLVWLKTNTSQTLANFIAMGKSPSRSREKKRSGVEAKER